MDFIAIDLNKYDVWEAFRRPVPVKEQSYVKTANWDSEPPPEDGCQGGIDDTECRVSDNKPKQRGLGQASPSFGNHDPSSGYQDPGTENRDGFGSGGLSEEQAKCFKEQKSEQDIDKLARDISKEIGTKFDHSSREYGAAILMDSEGNVRRSLLSRGVSSTRVDVTFGLRSGERLVAIVHNHPSGNTAPSTDDWDVARNFVEGTNGQPQIADAENYSEYIRDDQGRLAEFDYDNDQSKKTADNETRNDANSKC